MPVYLSLRFVSSINAFAASIVYIEPSVYSYIGVGCGIHHSVGLLRGSGQHSKHELKIAGTARISDTAGEKI